MRVKEFFYYILCKFWKNFKSKKKNKRITRTETRRREGKREKAGNGAS